jgi:hypothetical protein
MLKLLERSVATIQDRLILVAPPQANLPMLFGSVEYDTPFHSTLVREMQRLRGTVYLSEGNVKGDQLRDGLHQTPEDARSWHLLIRSHSGQITSCAWYLEHENTVSFQDLRVRECPLAKSEQWKSNLQGAVESELVRARRARLRYAEVGGWAVSKDRRCSSEGLVLALGAYGLCRVLGGALGITTANVRHSSSSILRRLGGAYLSHKGTPLPAYFDPKYNTNIELLRFDSREPNPKYAGLIQMLGERLRDVQIVAPDNDGADVVRSPHLPVPVFAA